VPPRLIVTRAAALYGDEHQALRQERLSMHVLHP
jgi:hypothetical protein